METTQSVSTFHCCQCKQDKPLQTEGGTGYGYNQQRETICYECCGKNDEKELNEMPIGAKTIQYFDGTHVVNWPGTLKIKPRYQRTGKHNIARIRIDFWFTFNGNNFHGVRYGDNTEIAHIRKIK